MREDHCSATVTGICFAYNVVMRDIPFPNATLGYCTNVHAGANLDETFAQLDEHAVAVRDSIVGESSDELMGVGLWLSAETVRDLMPEADGQRMEEFRSFLEERRLLPFTLNGFPYGDFHKEVVKRDVYLPRWDDRKRLEYTRQLARILVELLEGETEGSISTLPLGWRLDIFDEPWRLEAACQNLVILSNELAHLEKETGKLIHIDIEPEPGCFLDTAEDVISLYGKHLLPMGNEHRIRRYIRVCHDVCHTAVMFESQQHVLENYAKAGIGVGKVQISAAVRADFQSMEASVIPKAIDQLSTFREPRYLHQTLVRFPSSPVPTFFVDLPDALDKLHCQIESGHAAMPVELRTHFHVPLFLKKFGQLESTHDAVRECLEHIQHTHPDCHHFEVETYAWNVLPQGLQAANLAEGIAKEMKWVRDGATTEIAS